MRITRSPAPWLTDNLRRLFRKRNRALAKYRRSANPSRWRRYIELRKFCTNAVRAEKRALFNHLSSSYSSPRKFWNVLSRAGYYLPRRNNNLPSIFSDPDAINDHFVDSIPTTNISTDIINSYLNKPVESSASFSFVPFNLGDIYSIFKNIKLTSSNPFDLSGQLLVILYSLLSRSFTSYL